MYKIPNIMFFVVSIFIALLTDAHAIPSIAKPMMMMVPGQTKISMSQSGQAIINYTLTNNTDKTLANITIEPAFGVPDKAKSAITLQNNHCSSLSPGAQCTTEVVVQGNRRLPASIELSPRVCVFNKAVCSQPEIANRVNVHISLTEVSIAAGVDSISGNPIIAVSQDNGKTWNLVDSSVFNTAGTFFAAGCYGKRCIAAGENITQNIPIIAISQDNGNNWSSVDLSSLQITGSLNAASCNSNLCIAVGSTVAGSPIIITGNSSNGADWNAQTLLMTGTFNATSCSGNLCIAAGQDFNTNQPLVYFSQNSGAAWNMATLANAPLGVFNTASCSGSLCIAAGGDQSNLALIYITQDKGITWTEVDLSSFNSTGTVFGASCSGQLCVAAGGNDPVPMILVSQDSGNHWNQVNLSSLTGVFYTASCSGSLCVAAGEDDSDNPFIFISQDYGNHWNNINLASISVNAEWNAAVCSGSFCMVAGQDTPFSGPPLIAYTRDNGDTWQKVISSQFPTSGVFFGVSTSYGFKKWRNASGITN